MSSGVKTRGILGLMVLMVTLFFLFLIFSFLIIGQLKMGKSDLAEGFAIGKEGQIGVVKVEGPIFESEKIIKELLEAEKDSTLKAIIVRIDSPGGVVGPTQEIYEEIVRIDETKPVYASFGSVAASGGYYIGAAARKIYSTPGVMTGSIGVIMQFMDLSELYRWAKMRPETLKAGKYKDIGNPARGMTKEERNLMGDLMNDVHQQFIEDIENRRKHLLRGDIREIAQGQIFSGVQALELGLVDELAGLWEAGRRIYEELDLAKHGEFGLKFVQAKKKFSWLEFFQDMENKISIWSDSFVARKETKVMYLMEQ